MTAWSQGRLRWNHVVVLPSRGLGLGVVGAIVTGPECLTTVKDAAATASTSANTPTNATLRL
jgi:hypothetical protein